MVRTWNAFRAKITLALDIAKRLSTWAGLEPTPPKGCDF